ncbi:MAG TPA: hypothetical protein VHM70_24075 [Polyangiaceae bacterium]|jgi:hypothetical protein|nr:hypothetical protein [Polyangiaceae bacterium]
MDRTKRLILGLSEGFSARRVAPGLWLLLVGGAALTGCGPAAFPQELFTVGVQGADYPFMLSETPKTLPKKKGRPIHADSGTHASVQQSSYSYGNTTVTVTQTESAQSELSAEAKIGAQVQRRDVWVCFDKAAFEGTDFSTYGASSADRTLSVDAAAYR